MKQKVLSIIAQVLGVSTEEVDLDLGIGDLPEWDSLRHVVIIDTLEKEFGIKFDQADLMEVEDVSDLISLIEDQQ